MDCDTARLLLELARPHAPDLGADEADALQPSRERVRESLRRIGADAPLPENFNYAFLTAYGLTELPGQPGRKVTLLEFTHPRLHAQALVYVLPDRDFNLDGLTAR